MLLERQAGPLNSLCRAFFAEVNPGVHCDADQVDLILQGKGPVQFLAATLRPETMYGQTNCWVLPEGQYGAYRGLNNEIYVMTQRSALNLSYQDQMPVTGQPECLLSLTGQDLIGTPLKVRHTSSSLCVFMCWGHHTSLQQIQKAGFT